MSTGAADLTIVHLDEASGLVVVDKPSGLAVHRGWAQDEVFAVDRLREQLGRRVFPVHRLDRGASGLLCFALSPEAAAELHALFERGEVHRRYVALVRGVPPAEGVIDHAIPRREGGPRVPARTRYRRLAVLDAAPLGLDRRFSWVEALPETGRLHQVRRHLKHLGHPLIGDANYGRGELNRQLRELVGLGRLALHARALTLPWPAGGTLELEAPLPADLGGPLARLGLALQA